MITSINNYERIPGQWLTIETLHAPQLLPQLQKPTIIKYASQNPQKGSRWIVTLQHANESSGLYACVDTWKYLNEKDISLDYDLYFLIMNGYGAIGKENSAIFSQRFTSDQIDFNRIWYDYKDNIQKKIPAIQKTQIEQLTQIINNSNPEYIIDVHNTTGNNQPLGFISEGKDEQLICFLVDHIVHSNNIPGSLQDRFAHICESITIECGKTGTLASLHVATKIFHQFIHYKGQKKEDEKRYYRYNDIGRIVIKDNIEFNFYNGQKQKKEDNTFWIREDIEDFNQSQIEPFSLLGHYNGPGLPVIFLKNDQDLTSSYILKDGNKVIIKEMRYGLLFSKNKTNVQNSELGYLAQGKFS
ncbi:succinylglutamate desuccinylase/aspartoacylase family protein [Candidatus Woesearchaeota archaeon]|nr:succinylglutamate desuccinylase/aspartoacylase family protein [Candidatus Woesearchaeota archaeon]